MPLPQSIALIVYLEIHNLLSGSLYNLAVLPRGKPGFPLEVACETALVGKADFAGCPGNLPAGGNIFQGFFNPRLDEIGVGRQAGRG